MGRPSKYSPELRERAIRMVFEHAAEHRSQWAAIRSVAEKIGCANEVLRRWVRQAERDAGHRPGMTTDERQRLKELERDPSRRSARTLSDAILRAIIQRDREPSGRRTAQGVAADGP